MSGVALAMACVEMQKAADLADISVLFSTTRRSRSDVSESLSQR